jgi:hypothetical protein
MLIAGEVAGHELVFGELLVGSPAGRAKLLADYERISQSPKVPHQKVVAFVRNRHRYGQGASWIDLHLLASALVGRVRFWTADTRMQALAERLGVAFT